MDRTDARIAAMQLIYEWELGGGGGPETREGLLGLASDEAESDYMEALVAGATSRAAELDALLEGYLTGWSLERLRRVDLSILRLAAYELLYAGDVPTAVAVNEAVQMAKRFSAPEAAPFVNGVLGQLARDRGL
ncbi:MAG: transcription antitermination factor NusB [Promicromonosporaceae bacterium]|nr:transcription antitermination factor NusB [Promicromonosporaceae bacterium]